MDRADRVLGLLEDLYAAPGTPDGWPRFLENLRIAVDGSASSLLSQDLKSTQCSFAATTVVDPEPVRLYDTHWGSADPWAHSPNSASLSRRRVVVGDELIAHRDLQRTAYYEDYARRYDIVRALVGVLDLNPQSLSVISISGGERRRPFDEHDAAFLDLLVPHIGRAWHLHRRLIAASSAADDFATALDRFAHGVVLIDSKGRVLFMSREASRLAAMRDGLTVEHGELRAARPFETTRLRSIIAEAVATTSGAGSGAGGMLLLGRPSGRRSFVLLVSPMPARRTLIAGIEKAAAIVFVTDPEQSVSLGEDAEDAFRALFGLTPAEAKLTRLIAAGCSLTAAGAQLGLRRETVRSRLKTIFAKTNTHRQAELVRLALSVMPRP